MALVVVTAPAVEPVSVSDLKDHLNLTLADDDTMLANVVVAARQYVERFIGRPIVNTTFDLHYDAFPAGAITLPKAPVTSVTSVKYLDPNGVETTLSGGSYTADIHSDPGRIVPGADGWPDTDDVPNAVVVRFVAGHGAAADDVPLTLRQAVLLIAAHWYENREASLVGVSGQSLPLGVDAILAEHRQWSF